MTRFRRAVRRALLARRRLLAALCAAVALLAALRAVAAPPPPTVSVQAAARDLPAGTTLAASDLRPLTLPDGSVPAGVVTRAVGEVLAAPVRAGEPITDVRLVGDRLAAAHPGLTTMPVRLPDAGLVDLLAPGDRIDLIATDPQGGTTEVVAPDVLVLATPSGSTDTASGAAPGALVVLGVPVTTATDVAGASARWFLSWSYAD
ncbi:pilus assembly protein CpaB [Nocardioides coralli]|nr:pilus assembly protein CpaB [Nocardioides coralli]